MDKKGVSCTMSLFSKFSVVLILFIIFISCIANYAKAVEVIVDNSDGDRTRDEEWGFYQEEPDRWDSRSSSTAYLPTGGTHYLTNHNKPKKAEWYPYSGSSGIFQSGEYDVYAWWVSDTDSDNEAEYKIKPESGSCSARNTTYPGRLKSDEVTIKVDQRSNAGKWVYLGTCQFSGHKKDKVELKSKNAQDGKKVSADAIKFVSPCSDPIDTDGDSTGDSCDNCPVVPNATQIDGDSDGVGDQCDNCITVPNSTQLDADSDGVGDSCDNCQVTSNIGQVDTDGDSIGDLCDNCPNDSNLNQIDTDGDGTGDACETCDAGDTDSDGVCDGIDNCNIISNATQSDVDADGIGDVCDTCPNDADNDIDADGVCGDVDNCSAISNGAQTDSDADGMGDVCDPCPNDPDNDIDGDGICFGSDNCPNNANADQADSDGDGVGDACEIVYCPSLNISDVPLDAQLYPAPANIIFVLDDSGSMDWEFITEESDGLFMGYFYVFDDPGDNLYSSVISTTSRAYWKSQWSGYNKMYYNPSPVVDYSPWPTMSDADMTSPRSHPNVSTYTFVLSNEYVSLAGVSIKRAHYYTFDDSLNNVDTDGDGFNDSNNGNLDAGEDIYLVNLTNPITYYRFNDDGDNKVETGELVAVTAAALPSTVITFWDPEGTDVYNKERQNFANWYSFYRRRELTALGSIAKVIDSIRGVKVGVKGINDVFTPTAPLAVKIGSTDESATLLNALYTYVGQAKGTPLRRGLEDVGEFYDQTDGAGGGGLGSTTPFASEADGGACQQAFAIAMTDGYYNGSDPAVGNEDGDNGAPYADSYSKTLADVAMKYYENDLVDDATLTDRVPTNMYDNATHQHMVTYGVSFGVYGTLQPGGYDAADPSTYPAWPDPSSSDKAKIDDLWHASVNGHGLFFSASNSKELVSAVLTILSSIEARTGSAASVSVNGDELYEDIGSSILMFQTSYSSDGWGGDVKAYNINSATGAVITEPIAWSASAKLESGALSTVNGHTNRIIATFNGTQGVPFRYADLSTSQKALVSSDVLDYLRGDDSLEVVNGGTLRTRIDPLGDFVHSSAVYEAGVLYAGSNDGMLHAFGTETGNELFSYVPGLIYDNLSSLADVAYTHKYFVDLTPTIKAMGNTTMLIGGLGQGGKGYFALDISNPLTITTETILASRVKWEFPTGTDLDMGNSFSRSFIVKTADTSLNTGTDLEGYVVIFGNGYESINGKAVLYILNPLDGSLLRKIDTGAGPCSGLSTPVVVDANNDFNVDYVYAGDLLGNLWKFDLTDVSYHNWGIAFGTDNYNPISPVGTTRIDYADDNGAVRDNPKPLFVTKNSRPITTQPDVMKACGPNHGYMVMFGTGRYLDTSDLSDNSTESIYGIWDYGDDSDDQEYLGNFNPSLTRSLSNQPVSVTLLEQTVVWSGDVTANSSGDAIDSKWLRVLSDNPMENWVVEDGDNATDNPDPATVGIGSDYFDNDRDGTRDEQDEIDAEAAGVTHAGWYFDLPISKEKLVVDVMIRDGKLIAVSYVPQADPCSGGGYSIVHELDVCTGGRLTAAAFDINEDYTITTSDMIDVTYLDDNGYPVSISVPPTARKYIGRLQPPAILRNNDEEIKYFSSSSGQIQEMTETSEKRGMFYWREMN